MNRLEFSKFLSKDWNDDLLLMLLWTYRPRSVDFSVFLTNTWNVLGFPSRINVLLLSLSALPSPHFRQWRQIRLFPLNMYNVSMQTVPDSPLTSRQPRRIQLTTIEYCSHDRQSIQREGTTTPESTIIISGMNSERAEHYFSNTINHLCLRRNWYRSLLSLCFNIGI